MRLAKIIGLIGVAATLATAVPVTAEAYMSPYSRMSHIRKRAEMRRHHMYYRHHRMMMRHHRMMMNRAM